VLFFVPVYFILSVIFGLLSVSDTVPAQPARITIISTIGRTREVIHHKNVDQQKDAFDSDSYNQELIIGWYVVVAGRKPPSVLSGIRLSAHDVCPGYHVSWTCTGEDSPFHPFSSIEPRWVSEPLLPQASRTSSVRRSGLVSVPVPTISRPGLAPGHLPGRWGDFPRIARKPGTRYHTYCTRYQWVSGSIIIARVFQGYIDLHRKIST
jgi:hypothetical protein